MFKLVLAISAVLFLSACKSETVIEDNGPNRYERESAMRNCVGQYIIDNAPTELRLACTQAIYGGYGNRF